jgi:outer membrane immunogenic protein
VPVLVSPSIACSSTAQEASQPPAYRSTPARAGGLSHSLGRWPRSRQTIPPIAKVLDGWTIGAGVEYAVTNTVSVGAQYRYTDFGQAQFPVFAGASTVGTNNFVNVGLKESQLTARLNVKLDGLSALAGVPSPQPSVMPTKAPPALAYNWSGFYVGADLGAAGGSFSSDPFGFSATPAVAPPGLGFAGLPNIGLGGTASPGVIGGGQLGYNWQISRFVVGFEGDVQGASLQQSATALMFITCGLSTCASAPGTATARDLVQGSLRARLGYTFERWLVYGTGGWATADVQITSAPTAAATPGFFGATTSTNREILNGWTIGAGFDYAFTDMISLGAEYRHTDFGHTQFPIFAGATTGGFGAIPFVRVGGDFINAGLVEDQLVARINVKFGSLLAPAAVAW